MTLPVDAGGRIAVRLLATAELLDLWLEGADGVMPALPGMTGHGYAWRVTGDTFESPVLRPGAYVLHVLGVRAVRSFPVDVVKGEIAKVTIGP
jgi:hypothetical protein